MKKSNWFVVVMICMVTIMACGIEEDVGPPVDKVYPGEVGNEPAYFASYAGLLDGTEIKVASATEINVMESPYGTKYDLHGTSPDGDVVMVRLNMFYTTLDELKVGSNMLTLEEGVGVACKGPAPNSWSFDDQADSFDVTVTENEVGRKYAFTMEFNDASGILTNLVSGYIQEF